MEEFKQARMSQGVLPNEMPSFLNITTVIPMKLNQGVNNRTGSNLTREMAIS